MGWKVERRDQKKQRLGRKDGLPTALALDLLVARFRRARHVSNRQSSGKL
jgi:hypothetical protein